MAPTMERTPSATPSMYPDSVISLRGRNMAAVTTSATHTPMHRPNTGFSPTAVAKSTPWKKPPAYSMPRIEKMMSTMMGMIRSNTRPLSEMAMPLNSSTATFAASSSSSSSATMVSSFAGSASAAFGSEMPTVDIDSRALSFDGIRCCWSAGFCTSASATRMGPKSFLVAHMKKTNTMVSSA